MQWESREGLIILHWVQEDFPTILSLTSEYEYLQEKVVDMEGRMIGNM